MRVEPLLEVLEQLNVGRLTNEHRLVAAKAGQMAASVDAPRPKIACTSRGHLLMGKRASAMIIDEHCPAEKQDRKGQ